MLDKGTFGGTPAAHKLVLILNANPTLPYSKICRLFSTYGHTINELSKVNSSVGLMLALIFHAETMGKIDDFPDEVKTYMSNITTTKFRCWLKEQNSQTPYKIREPRPFTKK